MKKLCFMLSFLLLVSFNSYAKKFKPWKVVTAVACPVLIPTLMGNEVYEHEKRNHDRKEELDRQRRANDELKRKNLETNQELEVLYGKYAELLTKHRDLNLKLIGAEANGEDLSTAISAINTAYCKYMEKIEELKESKVTDPGKYSEIFNTFMLKLSAILEQYS